MLTVADLLEGLDVRLLAGEAALELPVRWVHISELADPTPWLSGGEVLLTTGMQLDTPGRPAGVRHPAGRPPAGRARASAPDSPTDRCPRRSSKLAAQRDFPVFEVPYELPFIAVTEAAFIALVNEQYAVLRRALAAQERLERIVLSQRGLDALAGALSTLIGAAVLVFDPRGELLAKHAFRRTLRAGAARAPARRSCASAAAAATAARSCPRSTTAAGRWRSRSPPTARRAAPGAGGARGVAGGDQGRRARCRTSTA